MLPRNIRFEDLTSEDNLENGAEASNFTQGLYFGETKIERKEKKQLKEMADPPTRDTECKTLPERENMDTVVSEHNKLLQEINELLNLSVVKEAAISLLTAYMKDRTYFETERMHALNLNFSSETCKSLINTYFDHEQLALISRNKLQMLPLRNVSNVPFGNANGNVLEGQDVSCNRRLNERTVDMLQDWYDKNTQHPYPSENEAVRLAAEGGITPAQVKKWMANKRVRMHNTVSVGTSRKRTHNEQSNDENTDHDTPSKKSKLPNKPLNSRATRLLKDWYNSHINSPYPSEEEKERLAAEGGISLTQVKYWFANKRSRSNNTRKVIPCNVNNVMTDTRMVVLHPNLYHTNNLFHIARR